MSELEILNHDEPGYKPLIDFSTWRVALLNSPSMYLPENVTYYDRHLETDEVFILLSGSVGILTAGQGEKPQDPHVCWMRDGNLYNVKKNTWHTLYMMPESKLAIIENVGTGIINSPRYYFSFEEKEYLLPKITI